MVTITRPAVEIKQGRLTLYLTYITPADLNEPNFCNVDELDVDEKQGFQRILDERRAGVLARDLVEAFPQGYANLPTTVFLAARKAVDFDPKTGQISFESDEVCPLSVVDGQHRLEALKRAAKDAPSLLNFQLPAAIAVSLDRTHQMYHFYIVNTSQKSVDEGLAQQIRARFVQMNGVEPLPYLPPTLSKVVYKGTEELAVGLADFLNKADDSPLKGRIQMANEKKEGQHRVSQKSLVSTLKRHVFHPSNDMYAIERINGHEKMNHIILNYFRAVDDILVGPIHRDKTRLYNNNGLYYLAHISKWTFQRIYNIPSPSPDFTVASISRVINDAIANLESDYLGIGERDWWLPSPTAPALNRQTADIFADAYQRAIQVSRQNKQAEAQV